MGLHSKLTRFTQRKNLRMKEKTDLQSVIDQIASPTSPVGMDAVYVHALILDQLADIVDRLARIEETVQRRLPSPNEAADIQ